MSCNKDRSLITSACRECENEPDGLMGDWTFGVATELERSSHSRFPRRLLIPSAKSAVVGRHRIFFAGRQRMKNEFRRIVVTDHYRREWPCPAIHPADGDRR